MSSFNIVKTSKVSNSFRANVIKGMFEIDKNEIVESHILNEVWKNRLEEGRRMLASQLNSMAVTMGELVDDFKEWTNAYSYDEAERYFKDEYSHNPNIIISFITRE